jgi:metal-responsive CopG/Arc/MetJ family transcriptional regulator
MSQDADRCYPVGVSLPGSVLQLLDEKRGKVPRSAFIVECLEKVLGKARKGKDA